ncbi:conserved protein of unknown function [Rhodovastum atsumiense]|uniref:Uncharacterized protein n=1 Tax=Rhodovastum atsumiense TaxID=504468 RepID=A0A5M6J383_9PROT|nr:hypothetical protein [Rhodovastum atsumiense]KAA5614058.1 hypothetical protein F1189_02300 [Rhodovastum atsumiense]CAH2598873.1 conserved protein of unknown function [Rhodovastum atsumiense]
MDLLPELFADLAIRSATPLSLPEHRQIEFFTRKRALPTAEDTPRPRELGQVASACTTFLLLQAAVTAHEPAHEGRTTWDIYKALPRSRGDERIVSEIFRILRIIRQVALNPRGEVVADGGLLRLIGPVADTLLALNITFTGVRLLESAVAYWFGAARGPYSPAYVEAMLLSYYGDIINEIKRFSDEGISPYQFRDPLQLNRHLRLDCDTVRARLDGEVCHLDIAPPYRNTARFPIDVFVVIRDVLYIIPAEALTDATIAVAELPRWRARLGEDGTLPVSFRSRFVHEPTPPDLKW